MSCPQCGKPMEPGTVYAPVAICGGHPNRGSSKISGGPKTPFAWVLRGPRGVPFSREALSALPQYSGTVCRSCGAILFSFETER